MDLDILKLLILIALFIGTYGFSLLPIPLLRAASTESNLQRRRRIDKCISFLSCFAAGVFLGTCLLDLYPEVEEKLVTALDQYISDENMFKSYPFAEFIMVMGFFLVLIVEQVVLAYKENHEIVELVESSPQPAASSQRNRSSPKAVTYNSINIPDEADPLLGDGLEQSFRSRSDSISSARSLNTMREQSSTEQYDQSMHQDQNSHSPIRSFIMLAALSLHSIFEGLAVGLQDTTADVLGIFGALVLHKCIIAFSIGLNLVQSKLSIKAILASNAAFCLASPIGIAAGIVIETYSNESAAALVNGMLQGIACGTFLYVTFFEVLPHEFNKPSDRVLKLLFVIIGFAFVNGVIFLEKYLTYKPSSGYTPPK